MVTLYHGSPDIVKKPEYGKGKLYNDYGQGFYCTERAELAKEWACSGTQNGILNQYEINVDGLNVLHLDCDNFSVLHWLTLLMQYRTVRLATPVMRNGLEYLSAHFSIDIAPYDVIIGYRADDSYFSFARAFVNNEISLQQLSYAIKLGKLGQQFVLKSPRAFNEIRFVSAEQVSGLVYYPLRKKRDDQAKHDYHAELEKSNVSGLFILDIIREGITQDDPRLR